MAEREDLAYLVVRERQSRDLALEARDVSVRWAHEAMARQYAERILALPPIIRA